MSIIVPVYNRPDLVCETLESIRSQDYRPIETIVVDDGSTDDTVAAVDRWISRFREEDVTLVRLGANEGKSSAVNQGFRHAKGEFVMVLDSDDLLLPGAITAEAAFLQDHSNVVLVSASAYILAGSRPTSTILSVLSGSGDTVDIRLTYGDFLLRGNPVIASTVLMRRSAIDAAGKFDVRFRYVHDWDYWERMSRIGPVGFLDRPVVYYRTLQAMSSSMNRSGTFREACTMLAGSSPRTTAWQRFRALVHQSKSHLLLAREDGNVSGALRIIRDTVRAIPYVVGGDDQ